MVDTKELLKYERKTEKEKGKKKKKTRKQER